MNERIIQVLREMNLRGLDSFLITDPLSIYYLTAVDNDPGERFYGFLLRENGRHLLVANRLFNVPEIEWDILWYSDTDKPVDELAEHLRDSRHLGVDKELAARFLLPLQERLRETDMTLASECVDWVRAIKDEKEKELMRKASAINDEVMELAAAHIKEGMTEKQIAACIDRMYLEKGASGNSFPTIVSFDANAADPHHMPDDTVLKEGMLVLIDMGCVYQRYCSDMTRTFFFRSATDKKKYIHDLVREANEKAESIIKPGVRLCDIDSAARDHIAAAGYGEYFNHRLGHFIGQRDHEYGDVSANFDRRVEAGMIFSIEPGVYLPGEFGVRIEDLVLVTEDGCEVLNKVDRKYRIL